MLPYTITLKKQQRGRPNIPLNSLSLPRLTCCIGGRAVAQLVADRAGEVAAEGCLGHVECGAVLGDSADGFCDGHSFVHPAEAGLRPPGLAAHQRQVRHIDADRHMVHCLCADSGKTRGEGVPWMYGWYCTRYWHFCRMAFFSFLSSQKKKSLVG